MLQLLLCAVLVAAQQSPTTPSPAPPGSTPPTLPSDSAKPDAGRPTAPPPGSPSAAPARELTTDEVKQQLDQKLTTEPDLQNAPVQTSVTADAITISGDLKNEHQHDLVMRLAHSFHGERHIIDHTTVAGQRVTTSDTDAKRPQ